MAVVSVVLILLLLSEVTSFAPKVPARGNSLLPRTIISRMATPLVDDDVLSDAPLLGNDAAPTKPSGLPVQVSPLETMTVISFGTNPEYRRGLITIVGITFLFASNSPALHAAFADGSPPILLVNAAISCIALVGLLFGGSALESNTPQPSALIEDEDVSLQAGLELGLWKFLGTTANVAGLSMTTADHGAFLIQLTTLIVPVVQGVMGVPIPRRIQWAVVLALAGVFLFTQDVVVAVDGAGVSESIASHQASTSRGDALCVVAAAFYATYDLRLFAWGKKVAARKLITGKIATQAILSVLVCAAYSYQESVAYLTSSSPRFDVLIPVILWSGIAVNAVAPYLQVGGQQAVGPTRCQTIYASQPLWASIMSYVFLGETVGRQGLAGGAAFLTALYLAATAEAPDPECGQKNCEV